MSKRTEAAEQTDAEIADLQARVAVLENAEPPVEPPVTGRPEGAVAYTTPTNDFTYEGGSADQHWREELSDGNMDNCAYVVEDPVDPSRLALKIFWGKDFPLRGGKIRSELKMPNNYQLQEGNEYEIRFQTYCPESMRDVVNVPQEMNSHCIQWHYIDSSGTSGINMNRGQFQFSFGAQSEEAVGEIKFDQWQDWKIQAKVVKSGGYATCWLDGDKVYDKQNVKITPGGPLNNKLGLYYWYELYNKYPEFGDLTMLYREYSITLIQAARHPRFTRLLDRI